MSVMESVGRSIKTAWGELAEGWEQLWHKSRTALTRFNGRQDEHDEADAPAVPVTSGRWGLLSAEVDESDEEVRVRVEVPGLASNDIDIEVRNQQLVLTGEKRYSNESFNGRVHLMETAYGRFQRSVPLPCPVSDDSATANLKQGVLEIRLPKTHPSSRTRIAVHSEEE